jgi:ABC-type branched-subunit amino acid transport system substrate-binding protein
MQTLLFFLLVAQGVTDDAILIGMEGPARSFSVDEENLGIRLMIENVNARGGIHGRRMVEKSYPRPQENFIEQATVNVSRLVEEDGVFLLFNFGGPGSVSIAAYAMENDVPYLFPHTALLTVDGDRHVYSILPPLRR